MSEVTISGWWKEKHLIVVYSSVDYLYVDIFNVPLKGYGISNSACLRDCFYLRESLNKDMFFFDPNLKA